MVVSRTGSSLLLARVLERLLKEEADMSHGSAWQRSRVVSANYRLRLLGDEVVGGRPCDVVELVPRVKNPHLLKGRAWVDAKDYSLVKIAGRLSTSPSFLLARPMIVRDYEEVDVSLDTIRSAPKHSCSKPFISVMKLAKLRYLDNPSGLHNRSRDGTFFPQTKCVRDW